MKHRRTLLRVDAIVRDAHFALRAIALDRAFSVAVIVVLALGIAVNTTVFTFINGMSFRGLPVDRADQIMQIETIVWDGRRVARFTAHDDYRDWQAATRTFSALAAFASGMTTLGDDEGPADRVAGNFVAWNAFRILRVSPIVGRDFTAEDDRPDAAPVVILGHHLWAARYARDPQVVGRTIRLNGFPTTVIGVMPEGFQFPLRSDLWQPLSRMPGLTSSTRERGMVNVFGRLADGASITNAQAEFTALATAVAAKYNTRVIDAEVVPFTHVYVSPPTEGPPLLIFVAAGGVLLIACANAANLLLARASRRSRDVALRAVFGASRVRIVRQLLFEAIGLALTAGATGLLLSVWGVRALANETVNLNLPFWIAFEFDARVFAYLTAVSLLTAIMFGLAPAWQLSRTSAHEVVKDSARGALQSIRSRRWASGLTVAEIALTAMLLCTAAVLVRSGLALYRADRIIDLQGVMTGQLALPAVKYTSSQQRLALYEGLQQRLEASASIESAAVATARPFVDSTSKQLVLPGEQPRAENPRRVQSVAVGPRYFETLALSMRRGRPLTAADGRPGNANVVINERLAQIYFPSVDPIGQRIQLFDGDEPSETAGSVFTIVGIAPTIRQRPMSGGAPLVYVPLALERNLLFASVLVRGAADSAAVARTLREELRALDPDVAAYNIESLQALSDKSRWNPRIMSALFTVFAIVACLLAASGLYALTAYNVSQRVSEIGMRMALGARRSDVARLFARRTAMVLTVGLAIGLSGAFAIGQVLQGLLVETSAADPVVYAAVTVFLAAVTAVACAVPLRRAMHVDPAVTLRAG